MNGVQAPASGRVRLLVRRGLLVAGLAGVGWLLSALFATSASAASVPVDGDDLPVTTLRAEATPAEQTVTQGDGLLDGLVGGLTDTVTTLTQTLIGGIEDTTSALPSVLPAPIGDGPAVTLPALLPDLDSPPVTLPAGDTGSRADIAPLPTASPATQRPATAATVPEHPSRPVVFVASPQRGVPSQPGAAPRAAADEHANSSPEQPAKAPAAPTAPGGGSTVSTAHDTGGGARGTHGVLTARTQQPPPSAGLTTRSRATEVSGRIDGLPATSPD